jgi:hypothetical protein
MFSLVDSFKTLLFVGGKHGSNYYWSETLAWWPMCQLQVDGDWFCEVGVGLCEVWLGQENSCCNWANLVH